MEVGIFHKGSRGVPVGGKEPACQCRRHKRYGFNPWVGKIPWRRAWQCSGLGECFLFFICK